MLWCSKCGEVDRYYIASYIRQYLYYDEDDNPQYGSEPFEFYAGKVMRCLNCNGKVKRVKDNEQD